MDIPKGYHLPKNATEKLQNPLLMRSELLDRATCSVCPAFDGFIAPADDEVWTEEMGMPAHCNCRYKLIPLFNVRDPENWVTPREDVPDLVSRLGSILTKEMVDELRLPIKGSDRLKLRPIKLEDLEDLLEPADLIFELFKEYLP